MDIKALQEASRELLRVIVIAIIPVLIDSLNKGMVDVRTVLIVGAIAGLRFIEKYLYEIGSENPVTRTLKFS